RDGRGTLVRECRKVHGVRVCRLDRGQRCMEVAFTHLEGLLGNQLDVEVVLRDGVVNRCLHALTEGGVLVQQGEPERAGGTEVKLLIDGWPYNLVDKCRGVLPVRVGCRAVVEDVTGVDICPAGDDRARCTGDDIRDIVLGNNLLVRGRDSARIAANEDIYIVVGDQLGRSILPALLGRLVVTSDKFELGL